MYGSSQSSSEKTVPAFFALPFPDSFPFSSPQITTDDRPTIFPESPKPTQLRCADVSTISHYRSQAFLPLHYMTDLYCNRPRTATPVSILSLLKLNSSLYPFGKHNRQSHPEDDNPTSLKCEVLDE